MDFKMRYEGAGSVQLPMSSERVKTGDECTVNQEQLVMLADAGYVIGPRSPYRLVDEDHKRTVVIAHKTLTLRDEEDKVRAQGQPFEASDLWLAQRVNLLANRRIVAADAYEGDTSQDDPPEADDEELTEYEDSPEGRILEALDSDNYNLMRKAVADLSDEPATGSKDDMRDRLEAMLEGE